MEKENIEYMINLISKLMKENKEMCNKRAKKIAKSLLGDNSLTPEQRVAVTSALITIETRLKKFEEAIMLGKSLQNIEMSPKQEKSINQKLEYVQNLINAKRNKSLNDNKEELKSLRSNLYEGKVETSKVKELVEKYAKTARGCIFIAELCKYFGIEEQGIKCLNGYRGKNATTIKKHEQKAMTQAIELLKQNIIRFPKEKWGEVYAVLDKASALEEPRE